MLMLSLGGIEPKAILGSLMRAEARVARRLFRDWFDQLSGLDHGRCETVSLCRLYEYQRNMKRK
ncbi:unnamed protein product [Rhizopus microsporus]